jgi:hypothetical protein
MGRPALNEAEGMPMPRIANIGFVKSIKTARTVILNRVKNRGLNIVSKRDASRCSA